MDLARPAHRRDLIVASQIFLIVFFFYWQLTTFNFLNFDDPGYVTKNFWVIRGLSWEGIHWAFTNTEQGHWHPLTWISHMLDIEIFGRDPFGHHLTNLLFFAANSVLVFLFLRRLSFSYLAALSGTLFFSLHPMRLESVAWVAERKDVLSFFFGILSLIFFIKYQKIKNKIWLIYSIIVFALSLMAKPTFISLPILIVLLDPDFWQKKWKTSNFWIPKISFALLSLIFSLISLYAQNEGGGLRTYDLSARLSSALVSYGVYLGKFFLPLETSVFYPHRIYSFTIAFILAVGLFLLSFLFFLIDRKKEDPKILMGWIWFLITTLPISGIIGIGGQAYADRWTYLPHLGILILVLASYRDYSKSKVMAPLSVSLSILFVSGLTWIALPQWRSSISLFEHALKVTPDNFMAHNNLGVALEEAHAFDEADWHYEQAVRLNPTYAEAVNNLGLARIRQSRFQEALILFERAVQLDPSLNIAKQNLELARRLLPAK